MMLVISVWVCWFTFFNFYFFSVAANLRKIVDEPQTNKNVTFKLVSVSESWSIAHHVIREQNMEMALHTS